VGAAEKLEAPLTESEAAAALKISLASLQRARRRGEIHPLRYGRRLIRYTDAILSEYRMRCFATGPLEELIAHAEAQRVELRKEPGIYFLYQSGRIVYVGKTTNFSGRLASHMFRKTFDAFSFLPIPLDQVEVLEARLIAQLRPPLNVMGNPNNPTARRTR
jgi:hypothetical protein